MIHPRLVEHGGVLRINPANGWVLLKDGRGRAIVARGSAIRTTSGAIRFARDLGATAGLVMHQPRGRKPYPDYTVRVVYRNK